MAATTTSRSRVGRYGLRLAALAIALLIWHAFAVGAGARVEFPTPWQTVLTFVEQMQTPTFWKALSDTLINANVGLLLSMVIGIPAGLLIGSNRRLASSTNLLVDFGRFIPSVAILPLALLVFGGTRQMALMMIIFGAVWPLLVQATYAVQQVSPQAKAVARAFRLSRWSQIKDVYVPSATPFLFTGIRIAATISLLLAISSEFLGGAAGLGKNLADALMVNESRLVFMYAITAALLGIGLNTILVAIQHKVLWWHPSVRAEKP